MNWTMRAAFKSSTVILVICAAVMTYWLILDNAPPFTAISIQVENPDAIYPGGVIKLHKKACNLREPVPNSARRTITDHFTWVLSDQSVEPVGCFEKSTSYPIPIDALIGLHFYQFCAEWKINPMKTRYICNPPVPFNVKASS